MVAPLPSAASRDGARRFFQIYYQWSTHAPTSKVCARLTPHLRVQRRCNATAAAVATDCSPADLVAQGLPKAPPSKSRLVSPSDVKERVQFKRRYVDHLCANDSEILHRVARFSDCSIRHEKRAPGSAPRQTSSLFVYGARENVKAAKDYMNALVQHLALAEQETAASSHVVTDQDGYMVDGKDKDVAKPLSGLEEGGDGLEKHEDTSLPALKAEDRESTKGQQTEQAQAAFGADVNESIAQLPYDDSALHANESSAYDPSYNGIPRIKLHWQSITDHTAETLETSSFLAKFDERYNTKSIIEPKGGPRSDGRHIVVVGPIGNDSKKALLWQLKEIDPSNPLPRLVSGDEKGAASANPANQTREIWISAEQVRHFHARYKELVAMRYATRCSIVHEEAVPDPKTSTVRHCLKITGLSSRVNFAMRCLHQFIYMAEDRAQRTLKLKHSQKANKIGQKSETSEKPQESAGSTTVSSDKRDDKTPTQPKPQVPDGVHRGGGRVMSTEILGPAWGIAPPSTISIGPTYMSSTVKGPEGEATPRTNASMSTPLAATDPDDETPRAMHPLLDAPEAVAQTTAPMDTPTAATGPTTEATSQGMSLMSDAPEAEISSNRAGDANCIDDFKAVMRCIPGPVTLITSCLTKNQGAPPTIMPLHAKKEDRISPQYRGMTISSMTAVTLSPNPIISFNVKKPSRTLDGILANGSFFAHVLASNHTGAAIADAFTKPYDDPIEPFHHIAAIKNVELLRIPKKSGARLTGPGVLARFSCQLLPDRLVEIGDHVVLFANVVGITSGTSNAQPMDKRYAGTGLVYAQREYRRVGATVEPARASDSLSARDQGDAVPSTSSEMATTVAVDNGDAHVKPTDPAALAASHQKHSQSDGLNQAHNAPSRGSDTSQSGIDYNTHQSAQRVASIPRSSGRTDDSEARASTYKLRKHQNQLIRFKKLSDPPWIAGKRVSRPPPESVPSKPRRPRPPPTQSSRDAPPSIWRKIRKDPRPSTSSTPSAPTPTPPPVWRQSPGSDSRPPTARNYSTFCARPDLLRATTARNYSTYRSRPELPHATIPTRPPTPLEARELEGLHRDQAHANRHLRVSDILAPHSARSIPKPRLRLVIKEIEDAGLNRFREAVSLPDNARMSKAQLRLRKLCVRLSFAVRSGALDENVLGRLLIGGGPEGEEALAGAEAEAAETGGARSTMPRGAEEIGPAQAESDDAAEVEDFPREVLDEMTQAAAAEGMDVVERRLELWGAANEISPSEAEKRRKLFEGFKDIMRRAEQDRERRGD